jgi:predicted amidophosphoribosyltransferase
MPTPSLYPVAAPVRRQDGKIVCPLCRAWLNRHTPDRCPECRQPLADIQHGGSVVADRDLDAAGVPR